MALTLQQLDELYRRHAPAAFRRARRLLGADADAHEIVHDLFLSLCERPEQYAGRSSITTFLYAAVTHACLNRIRNQRNRERLAQRGLREGLLPPPAERLPADESWKLRQALAAMPEPLAQVAVYYHYDDLSQEEIARIMGCSRRHVGDLLERVERWAQNPEESVWAD